jgi:hypothetical protein
VDCAVAAAAAESRRGRIGRFRMAWLCEDPYSMREAIGRGNSRSHEMLAADRE